MIVYSATKTQYLYDVDSTDGIEVAIAEKVKDKLNITISPTSSEYQAFKNSQGDAMYQIMSDTNIPGDALVAIEYGIPMTKNRIDFMVLGKDKNGQNSMIIIELKQWSDVQPSSKDGIVSTRFKHGLSEEPHPSYQAYSYESLLKSFNVYVYESGLDLSSCAYLHNLSDDSVIKSEFYEEYTKISPAFTRADKLKLKNFIAEHVKSGVDTQLLYEIERSEIRPSKLLADSVASMVKGNSEFVLIDDQKIVFENIMHAAKKAHIATKKTVIICKGGPGTGKSVIAVNALSNALKMGIKASYLSRNSAPREVIKRRLKKQARNKDLGDFNVSDIDHLFRNTWGFTDIKEVPDFDLLIVDEAHRLNEKSGMFGNLGQNQIMEIIAGSNVAVFFVDDDQRVTLKDIGTSTEIKKWAELANAEIIEYELTSQFRCNGSDGYIAWLDNTLQIRETANYNLVGTNYNFELYSDPQALHHKIKEMCNDNLLARLLAGYCWEWPKPTRNISAYPHIVIGDYKATWNLEDYGQAFVDVLGSESEVGCIHTSQGLELDYVGVIVGPDLIVRDGIIITRPEFRAKTDLSIKGWRSRMKEDPERTAARLDSIIKNTYRTLMSRGKKGCYIYCTDPETQAYFSNRM